MSTLLEEALALDEEETIVELYPPAEPPRPLGLTPLQPPAPPALAALPPHWERVRPYIEAALEGDPVSPEVVEDRLRGGTAMLWASPEAAIVTELAFYPSGEKAIQTIAAGGKIEEVEAMIPGIEAYGRSQGATVARIEGRRGWERRMKAFGYRFQSVIVIKDL